jgi:hypothetical protein
MPCFMLVKLAEWNPEIFDLSTTPIPNQIKRKYYEIKKKIKNFGKHKIYFHLWQSLYEYKQKRIRHNKKETSK